MKDDRVYLQHILRCISRYTVATVEIFAGRVLPTAGWADYFSVRPVMAPFDYLNRRLPESIYAGVFRPALGKLESVTLWERFRNLARRRLGVPAEGKLPRWVAELYQLAWVGVALALLAVVALSPRTGWLMFLVGVVALYRPYEIALFALRWVFWDPAPIHRYTRSLTGFLLNLSEIIVFYSVAYVVVGCVKCESGLATAFYSSLRTTVTIGPVSTAEPPDSVPCGVLLTTQIAVSFFLTIVVIASIVGEFRKRGEVVHTTA